MTVQLFSSVLPMVLAEPGGCPSSLASMVCRFRRLRITRTTFRPSSTSAFMLVLCLECDRALVTQCAENLLNRGQFATLPVVVLRAPCEVLTNLGQQEHGFLFRCHRHLTMPMANSITTTMAEMTNPWGHQ